MQERDAATGQSHDKQRKWLADSGDPQSILFLESDFPPWPNLLGDKNNSGKSSFPAKAAVLVVVLMLARHQNTFRDHQMSYGFTLTP